MELQKLEAYVHLLPDDSRVFIKILIKPYDNHREDALKYVKEIIKNKTGKECEITTYGFEDFTRNYSMTPTDDRKNIKDEINEQGYCLLLYENTH